ncbi:MAG: 16S rRNA (cytosine(967)-C(5))-methyltransferase RsmB [Candidatus Acidiferrales bacterium]
MAISIARRIAFDVLQRVESEDAYASDELHAALDANIKATDAALATELTMGVLRRRGTLDFLLGRNLEKPVARLDLPVALSLRLGLYQLRFMRKVPMHAAVNESVELMKRARKASAASLVNAVLRKATHDANKPAADFLPKEMPIVERLAILHSHPRWLVGRWLARLGEVDTVALLEANNCTPRLTCSLNDANAREAIFEQLRGAHLRVEEGRLLQNAFSVSGGSPSRTKTFREGAISIQDEASQAVPLLLKVKSGNRVLDLCAAPGGKTAVLARAAGESGLVLAADLYAHRLRACKAQFARLRLDHIDLVAVDARKPLPFAKQFERILVDAPCSGTGTLARHPEIRWRLKPEQLHEFHRLQVAILRNAIAQAAPGGKILYSTCSMEPEENDRVIEEAIRVGNIRRADAEEMSDALNSHLAPDLNAAQFFDDTGAFRTSPARDGTDGFFAALLIKNE